MKTLLEVLVSCLTLAMVKSASLYPSDTPLQPTRNDHPDRVTASGPLPLANPKGGGDKIYGTEPYQLQFQEPPLQTHAHHHNYYPTNGGMSQRGAVDQLQRTQHHHYQRQPPLHQSQYNHQPYPQQRQRTHDDQQSQRDYDPFYFSARNGVVPVGARSRRNSKFRDIWNDDFSDNLLNEDVHFFRRESGGMSTTGGVGRRDSHGGGDASVEFIHKDNHHQRLPVYGDYPPPPPHLPYFPPRTGYDHHRGDHTEGRQDPFSSSSSATSYDRRGDYPLHHHHPNHLDFYDSRQNPHMPKLFASGPERYAHAREPIDGWSVQVGTRLRVHDDGRERNPARFYVRDEKPGDSRRYPHRYDYPIRPYI